MSSSVLVVCLAVAVGTALGVVALESPVRSAGALVGALCGVSAALVCLDAPLLPGLLLWLGVGGVGAPLLATVLMLHQTAEERGLRRLRLTKALGLFVLVYVGAALAAVIARAADALGPPAHVEATGVARALFGESGVAISLAALALAAAAIGALSLARRRG